MADLNLIDFYKDTALVLLSLQRAFPRKIDLFVEDLIGPDEVDEFGLHTKRHEACLGAMLWLAEEGYLRFVSTIRQEGIDQAVLTSGALVKLTAINSAPLTPISLDDVPSFEANERLTMLEHMRRALASQSSEQLIQVMRAFFAAQVRSDLP
ncbi:MAG TPA: hypothetical protein VM553_14955 [Dongiaceae bacterium]|nr:hypothetical protein [Dongiaceae bacterium]